VTGAPLVAIRGLRVAFDGQPALHGIDLDVASGEAVGLVGESGCGKSVTWLAALGLLPTRAAIDGQVRLGETELLGASAKTLETVRGGRIAMIFQDPASSLNPVHRIGRQITEARRGRRRSACSTRSASPMRRAGSTPTRMSSLAGRTSA
jgi:peptide/nickel transport system ATP-binding protein